MSSNAIKASSTASVKVSAQRGATLVSGGALKVVSRSGAVAKSGQGAVVRAQPRKGTVELVVLSRPPIAVTTEASITRYGLAMADLIAGQIVRVDSTGAYPTGYDDPLAAIWQLALCKLNSAAGSQATLLRFGAFGDVAYNFQSGPVWLGSIAQRYAVQTPPPMIVGTVSVVLGRSAGGTEWLFDPDTPTVFQGASS